MAVPRPRRLGHVRFALSEHSPLALTPAGEVAGAGREAAASAAGAARDATAPTGDVAARAGEGAAYTAGAAVGATQVRCRPAGALFGMASAPASCLSAYLPALGNELTALLCLPPSAPQAAAGGVKEAATRVVSAAEQAARGAAAGVKGEPACSLVHDPAPFSISSGPLPHSPLPSNSSIPLSSPPLPPLPAGEEMVCVPVSMVKPEALPASRGAGESLRRRPGMAAKGWAAWAAQIWGHPSMPGSPTHPSAPSSSSCLLTTPAHVLAPPAGAGMPTAPLTGRATQAGQQALASLQQRGAEALQVGKAGSVPWPPCSRAAI